MNDYLKLLENYFNLTQSNNKQAYDTEITNVTNEIISIQDSQIEITRVLKYKGSELDIMKGLENRGVKGERHSKSYTITEEFVEQ